MLSGQGIIENRDRTRRLDGQCEDLAFPGPEIGNGRKECSDGGRHYGRPRQGRDVRQIVTKGAPRLDLADRGGRDQYSRIKPRQEVQQSELVQVLKR